MKGAFYPHQPAGTTHLLSMPHGLPHALLADDPGTGKTVMAMEADRQAGCKTTLIVCPAIAKEQWRRMAIEWEWADDDEIQIVYGRDAIIGNRPRVIVNYDLARVEVIRKQLAARKWHSLVMDEAHKLKTHRSQQTLALFHRGYGIANSCYWKWALSGSIMPNRPAELYPLLKTMAPKSIAPYDNHAAYVERFCGGVAAMGKGASNITELTERIQKYMLKRKLKDVWRDMPPLLENVVWLDVPYRQHPEWPGDNFLPEATERRVVAEAKAPYTAAYVDDRFQQGIGKIVIFTYHRQVLETLYKTLAKYNPVKIYGGVSSKDRELALAKFKQDDTCRLFLLQIGSGGLALDGLQHVCHELVAAEPEWSPGGEDQAIARILRLGQTHPVILTKLLASDSYEEVIYNSNHRKRKVIEIVLAPNGGTYIMSIEESLASIAKSLEKLVGIKSIESPIAAATLVVAPAPAPALAVAPAPMIVAPAFVPALPAPSTNGGISREQFTNKVLEILNPLGDAGVPKLNSLLGHFKVEKLSALPDAKFPAFLAMLV